MDAEQANAAGVGSLPGAVVDFLGDRLIAGKFLPKNYSELLKGGSLAAKKAAIAEIFANGQLRGAALRMARDFGAQGLSEAGGDWTAGHGAYLATGDETFKPSVSDLRDSFLVGGVIGAGMSGIETYRDRRAKTKIGEKLQGEVKAEEAATEEEVAAGVTESIQQGQFADAEAKAFPVVRNWEADALPMDVSNTRFANAPALRFEPNRNARARAFLPNLAPEELLPPSTASETDLEAYEGLNTPGKQFALEIAAHEELTAFGRPEGVINNYGEKIRNDFLNNRVAEPAEEVQPLDEAELKAVDPEALPSTQLPENTVQIREDGTPTIQTPEALESFVGEMNTRFGEGKWEVRRFGDNTKGGYNETSLREAFNSENTTQVSLANTYIQGVDPNTQGQPSFRVHAIKRNGKMEVVPYATTNNALSLPFVFENDQRTALEAAALASVNENLDNLGEGKIVGVDVTLGKDGTPTVTETQAVDSSLDPTSVDPTPPSTNEYVNAAIYAALKGRVPAFALQARQALREQAATSRLNDDIAYDIGVNLSQLAKNKEDFGNQVQGFYGDRYAPQIDALWQAARDKDMTKVRAIVAGMTQQAKVAAEPAQVMESNQKILDETQAELDDAAKAAAEATKKRKANTQKPAEDLNEVFNIPAAQEGEPMTVEDIQQVVNDLTGGSVNIRVINNYDAPFAGRILNRRDIELNAARITSPEHAREVLLEEAIHAVWNDAGIQDAWAGIKALATRDEVLEIQQHYASHGVNISYGTALEEWANREVRRKYLQEQGPVKTFVDRVWAKLKEIFGLAAPENATDASRIMHRALEYLSEETRRTLASSLPLLRMLTYLPTVRLPVQAASTSRRFTLLAPPSLQRKPIRWGSLTIASWARVKVSNSMGTACILLSPRRCATTICARSPIQPPRSIRPLRFKFASMRSRMSCWIGITRLPRTRKSSPRSSVNSPPSWRRWMASTIPAKPSMPGSRIPLALSVKPPKRWSAWASRASSITMEALAQVLVMGRRITWFSIRQRWKSWRMSRPDNRSACNLPVFV
jgi:hypothetical protein